MPGAAELQAIKRRLSIPILRIPGVSGLGLPRNVLTVYLAEDSEATRKAVADLVEREAPGTPIAYVVTGQFQTQTE